MNNVVNVYKPIGLTPLQLIEAVKRHNPDLNKKKIAYAGRLDPMAEGVVLLLVEPETKNRTHYQNLDKVYEFTMLLGIQTDTHDLLGKITNISNNRASRSTIRRVVSSHLGIQTQKYPTYSSKTVKSKPLYWWARNNLLNTISIPSKQITIHKINIVNESEKDPSALYNDIVQKISLISGDFRQDEISADWKNHFMSTKTPLKEITVRMSCSSGTYVRSLVDSIGIELETYAVTSSIKRLRVGHFSVEDSLRLTT